MTDQPFPDLLVSEARTRHYVDGEMITARRGIDWPAGTTVTDDPIEEKVVLSGLGGSSLVIPGFNWPGSFGWNTDDGTWGTAMDPFVIAATEFDVLLIHLFYTASLETAEPCFVAFDFIVDGSSVANASYGWENGQTRSGTGVNIWNPPNFTADPTSDSAIVVGGSLAYAVVDAELFEGIATIEFLQATDDANTPRSASGVAVTIQNLGPLF